MRWTEVAGETLGNRNHNTATRSSRSLSGSKLRRMPKFSLRTLFAAVVVCAILSAIAHFLFVRPNINAELHIRNAPIQTIVRVDDRGFATSERKTYSIGQYGVTEFGNVRLAVRGCTFSGESSGGILFASQFAGGGGSTGTGNRRFTHDGIVGGSRCTFGGLAFSIVDSELRILDEKIPANGEPTLVIISRLGETEAIDVIGKPSAR